AASRAVCWYLPDALIGMLRSESRLKASGAGASWALVTTGSTTSRSTAARVILKMRGIGLTCWVAAIRRATGKPERSLSVRVSAEGGRFLSANLLKREEVVRRKHDVAGGRRGLSVLWGPSDSSHNLGSP